MSSLKRLFGAPKKSVNHDTATEALQAAEEQLNKKQLFLEKKINEEIAKAKQFGLKNKRAALECLRKKALYEKQLELNDGALMKLQAQRNALDSALMNKNILDTMKTVNSAMKNIHKDMDVDKVHDLMDNVNEQQEIANEIAAAISMPTGTDLVDEDELLRELEELTEEDVAKKLLDVHDVGELPAIPVGEPTRSKSKRKLLPFLKKSRGSFRIGQFGDVVGLKILFRSSRCDDCPPGKPFFLPQTLRRFLKFLDHNLALCQLSWCDVKSAPFIRLTIRIDEYCAGSRAPPFMEAWTKLCRVMDQMIQGVSDATILLVEGFNGGSHKQLISTLEGLLTEKGRPSLSMAPPGNRQHALSAADIFRETVCVVSLPATKWHWRARTGALALAALIPKSTCANDGFRVLFTSAVFSLPELLALRPDLASIPHKYLYFHENQLTYPLRGNDEGATKSDYQFAYIQVLSALAADLVLFNSAFNMHSFYERLPAFLAAGLPTPPSPRVPEPRELVEKLLKPKSRVLHFLVEPPPLPLLVHGDVDDFEAAVCSQAERIRARGRAPLRILWNHRLDGLFNRQNDTVPVCLPSRWDYDKNPADFFRVIFDLANISVDEEFFNLGRSTLRPSTGDVIAPSEMSPPSVPSEQVQPRFQISVIGGSSQDVPRIFPMAESYLRPTGHIAVWGFVGPREAYWRTLADCDVIVSTSKHEFFGVAVVEAVAVGCVPLLPHRLAYPELLAHGPSPSKCLYRTLPQMRKQLKCWIGAPDRLRERAAKALLDAYDRKGTGTGAWLRKGVLSHDGLRREYLKLFDAG
ncbi:unnamed protein product [Taenia asiatica]|uniref:tRNA-queuosine alpha-mannosyltransferase n=1 Tax=Taenia asiatica TaxID=60517 RepID=A0A158R908_TAEAS|nr:unnamed protein product [Taenia asiatica]